MITYGYCRISTKKQNIERQVRNIKQFDQEAVIVKEIYTGSEFHGRKELDKILKKIKTGDRIVFDSVSRMSRNADEGFQIYEALFQKGVSLVFLKEPDINTEVYRRAIENQINLQLTTTGNHATDQFIRTIINALNEFTMDLAKQQIRIKFEQSEKEVADLRQRTKEGIETARLNGSQIGHKPGTKLNVKKAIEAKKIILEHSSDFNGNLNDKMCMKLAGITRNTYYKYKRELREDTVSEKGKFL